MRGQPRSMRSSRRYIATSAENTSTAITPPAELVAGIAVSTANGTSSMNQCFGLPNRVSNSAAAVTA